MELKKGANNRLKVTGDGRIKGCLRTQIAYAKGALEGDEEFELHVTESDFGDDSIIYFDAFGEEGVEIQMIQDMESDQAILLD